MKFKTIFSLFIAAGLWLNSFGLLMAYDSHRGHREYRYNAYEETPKNYYDAYPGESQKRRTRQDSREDAVTVLGVLSYRAHLALWPPS